jgi:hypothetical protein
MKNKILAILLVITIPIWFLPVVFTRLVFEFAVIIYTEIYNWLEDL